MGDGSKGDPVATGPTVAIVTEASSETGVTTPGDLRCGAEIRPPLVVIDRATYDVRGEIARGGLGRILEAHDHRLDRPVAIKELLAEHLREGSSLAARFAREALLTARLQHPAIVPVYEAGLWPDGAPFYTMKLVEGQSLEAAVRERPTLEERLALVPHVIDVANALAYAHGRRIIHRDLKPANVLVGAFGETVVIDWGLAKELGPIGEAQTTSVPPPVVAASVTPGATQAGSVLGTPAYMPPEQALGLPVDERADVYALGALLYHVIAGGAPYSGKSSEQILAQVVREPPEDLLAKEPGAPPELAAIVRKALARDPGGRYPTAAELAADLLRYQSGQRVKAHRYGAGALLWRLVKRHRAALTVAALMLVVLAIVVVRDVRRIVWERDRAEAERAEAQRLREHSDARGDALALREADALLAHNPRQALAWLKHLAPESRLFGAARILAGDALARGVPRRVLSDTAAGSLAMSSDGRLLAIARPDDVLVVDVDSGQTMTGRGGPARVLAFAPDGQRLAYAGSDGVVHVWSRAVRASTDLPGHDGDVTALAFGGNDRLVTAGHDGTLRIWDLGQGLPARIRIAHETAVLDVAVAGDLIATAGLDGTIKLWDAGAPPAAPPRAVLACAVAPVRLLLAPDGSSLAAVCDDRRVTLWDLASGKSSIAYAHAARMTAGAIGPGGILATGDADGGIHVFDPKSHRSYRLVGHEDDITVLAFTADGALVSGGRDHTTRLWDIQSGKARFLLGHEGDLTAVASAGKELATAGRDRTVRLWDLAADQPRVELTFERPLFALAISADGKRLAAGGSGGLFLIDEKGTQTLPARGERIRALSFGGNHLAVGLESGTVRLLAPDGTVRDAGLLAAPVSALAFDPAGKRLVAGSAAGLSAWDAAGARLFGDGGAVLALAFAPDGARLATAGAEVRLWEMAAGRARALEGALGPFVTVAFSPDGHTVAAGGRAGVALWSVAGGGPRVLGSDPVVRIAFSTDGKLLVGVAGDRLLRVWDVAAGRVRLYPVDSGTLMDVGAVRQTTAATAGSDGSVRIWDLGSGRSRRAGAHAGAVVGLVRVEGDRAVASAGEDGTVRIWPDGLPEEPQALRAVLQGATDAQVGEEL